MKILYLSLDFWTLSIVVGLFVLVFENWWLHVLNPDNAIELSFLKLWLKKYFGSKAIPVSSLLIGLVGVWILRARGFHYDWFPFLSGIIIGNCYYDSLAIRRILRRRNDDGRRGDTDY